MTKITLKVEIEVPDDGPFGVSPMIINGKPIPLHNVAGMAHQNFFDLLNRMRAEPLLRQLLAGTDLAAGKIKQEMYDYLIPILEAEKAVWDQIITKSQREIQYRDEDGKPVTYPGDTID